MPKTLDFSPKDTSVNRKFILIGTISSMLNATPLPQGFFYVQEQIPNIELEIRYHGSDNFIGKPIDGYQAPTAILTKEAILALKKVQKELEEFGLGLKIFDAYRPQKAVDHFVQWGKNLNDKKMKASYYPNVEKKNLFKEGYIAKKSGHSRGSTVDLTLIDLKSKEELDMGSPFDLFDQRSWVNYLGITSQQRANRAFLHSIMLQHGFKALSEEWWHFTLREEPYKKRYFDFNVR